VASLLQTFPVVVVSGARQVGKSTLVESLVTERGGAYSTLDDISVRSEALADPRAFVAGRPGLLAIDEVQLAPELLHAIKLEVDRNKEPGRFLLTGSTNLLRMRTVGESLAGRSAWVELGPLAWSERLDAPLPSTLDDLFSSVDATAFVRGLAPASPARLAQARRLAVEGSMPGTTQLDPAARRAWYQAYRQTFLERDLRQIAQIENLPQFNRLLTLASLRSSLLLNRSALAAECGLPLPTLRRYLDILEVAYQFYELPPYYSNVGKRLVKTPKLYANDVGLIAQLGALDGWEEASAQGRAGALFESWAVAEVRTLDRLSARPSVATFWRTSAGREVDLLLERGNKVVAIEFKAAATVTESDTAGLRELQTLLGSRLRMAVVACMIPKAEVLGQRLCAVPISSLLGV
jgi:hypothetical protein